MKFRRNCLLFSNRNVCIPPCVLLDSNKLDCFKHYRAIFGQELPGKYEKILACFEYVASFRLSRSTVMRLRPFIHFASGRNDVLKSTGGSNNNKKVRKSH